MGILREPLFHGLLTDCCRTQWSQIVNPRLEVASAPFTDESIASWARRKVSPLIADRFVSAAFHGIYAGDIEKLSVASLMPSIRYLDTRHSSLIGYFIWSLWNRQKLVASSMFSTAKNLATISPTSEKKTDPKLRNASVWTLQGGLQKIPQYLTNHLQEKPSVQLYKGHSVTKIVVSEQGQKVSSRSASILLLAITSLLTVSKLIAHVNTPKSKAGSKLHHFSHVVSTIGGSKLTAACSADLRNSQLDQTPAVTVMVVNLYFKNPNLLKYPGFGYLIPRCLPFEQNPELALGVVFDTYSSVGMDTAEGTKLTVMFGGHYWDCWTSYPSKAEGEEMARKLLARHLKIHEEPHTVMVNLQRDCIPQYTVGHAARMQQAHNSLLSAYNGRVRVAGSWFTGVSFHDCTRAAFDVVMGLKEGKVGSGLERMMPGGEKYVHIPTRMIANTLRATERR